MRKNTVIAQCLVNSNMIGSLEQAEHALRSVFDEDFPDQDFALWNSDLNDTFAAQTIHNVGRASMINVKRFIEDLR